jgi:hypothetical protein
VTHNLEELVENQKQTAANIIDRCILKLPEDVKSISSRQIVDLIVAAALLEVAMVQSKTLTNKENI